MRSIFFQTSESSAGAGTQPAGCGGESNEFEVLTKASNGYALILPNPIFDVQLQSLPDGKMKFIQT
ncbi:MAG: hypothetical protein ABIN36_10035 [Ferruginibacter sp.]